MDHPPPPDVQAVYQELEQARLDRQHLEERLATLEAARFPPEDDPPVPPRPVEILEDFPVEKPTSFEGKRSELADFLTQLKVYFLAPTKVLY